MSAVMLLSLIPTASIPARAATVVEKPDVDVSDTGKYFGAGIGKGASQALFVNGAFGDAPTVGEYDGKLVSADTSVTADVSTYNMMNCFGMYRNGAEVSKKVVGFEYNSGNTNKLSINWGTGQYCDTLNVCTYNNDGGNGSLKVTIEDNPTLKALASSGGLQVYFKGYACPGKESRKAWPDDHTYVTGKFKITNGSGTVDEHSSGKAKAQKKAFGTDGWVTLSTDSVITISWSLDRSAGKFSNGWADKDVGLGDSVLLFRKVACPNIANYTLTANGDYSAAGSRGAEVLLGNGGRIQLDLNVTLAGDPSKSDVVVSSLGGTKIPYSDDYNLLLQLGKRVLFKNTEGTGYDHQGEPVYMKLTRASGEVVADTDDARLSALQGNISSLHYEWNAGKGDYYGNNAIPGEGDWAGLVSSSNSLNLIDSIVLASFHDLAGNPLMLGGNLVPYQKSGTNYTTNLQYEPTTSYQEGVTYYKDGDVYKLVVSDPGGTLGENYYTRRDVLTGTVKLNNITKTGVANPFAAGNSDSAGFGFVINAVTPTYSRSTNAVQPDILTRLTLNYGDKFDIALNFSEIVKLREFKPDGDKTVPTGYAPENLYLKLNNGLRARYKSGLGTRQLLFTVSVPDSGVTDVTDNGNYLEIESMFVEDAQGNKVAELATPTTEYYKTYNGGTGSTDTYSVAADYVLTDYVGNPVCEFIGKKGSDYDTTMAWAQLQMDNTKPQIHIDETDYIVTVTEDGSGVFHIDNATQGGGNSSGIVYYVWVNGTETAKAVSEQFIANNFEKVKRFSLAPSEDDKVTVGGTTYRLKAALPGTDIERMSGEGDWHLLVFTADMTWDSARQLIQYGKASYKGDPAGYLSTLAGKLGITFDDMFEPLPEPKTDEQKADWEANYHTYYYKNDDGTFSNIRKGVEYPEWKADTYYTRDYTALTTQPDGWDPYQKAVDDGAWKKLSDGRYVPIAEAGSYTLDDSSAYTTYYTLENGKYVPVKPVSGVPEFKTTYFGYGTASLEDVKAAPGNYYVRDTDADGGAKYTSAAEKYVPDFVAGGTYTANGTLVASKPADWATNYSSYQYGVTEYQPLTGATAPAFEENKYYSVAYQPLVESDYNATDKTVKAYDEFGVPQDGSNDWETAYTDYYMKSGDVYTKVTASGTVPAYAENTYYRVVYTKLETEPADWATAYTSYVEANITYQPVTAEFPSDVTYYSSTANTLSTKPADWNSAYFYYSCNSVTPDQYTPVQYVSAPEFEAGKYYTFGYNPVTTEPANWAEDYYTKYYYNTGTQDAPSYRRAEIESDAQRKALTDKGIRIVSTAPSFSGFTNGVYKAKADAGFMTGLAAKISDTVRRNAFVKDMLAASTDVAKIEVIRRYSAFVDDVYDADVAFMAKGGNYTNWNANDYSKNDSNWAYAISGADDLISPTVTFGTLTGDGTENVTIPVTVSDKTGVSEVKYQFVSPADAKNITVDTAENWKTVAEDKKTSFIVTTKDEQKTESGDYVLCVYAKDTKGNATVKQQTVTVNSQLAIEYSLTDPAGTKPYKAITGVSATFSGTAYGKNIFARDFKVYAVIDDNATKAATADDWGAEITGSPSKDENGVTYAAAYAMPEKKGVTGYYYLHIKYTYEGAKEPVLIDRPYWLEDSNAQITFNQLSSDSDSITVEISASGAIEYAITAVGASQPTDWTAYNGALKILKSDYEDMTAVRVWAKANGDDSTIRSADFMLSGDSKPTGVLANPRVTLLDVLNESDKRYAIVRFDSLGDALSVGAEYSVAAAAPNAATDSYVWQRWMPLDNMVKVKLGAGDARLIFKFRNGDAVTTSGYPALNVAADATGTGEAWTVATRSTLRVVNGTTGVRLTMQSKSADAASETVHANGVYKNQNGDFQAVVSNISNNPPSYSLVWSDGGDHIGENGAKATSVSVKVTSDENITVKSLTIDGVPVAPARAYLFKSNSTAVFTLVNEAGAEATATAKVTWLDTVPLDLTITEDYTGFTRYNNSIANGARLIVTPTNSGKRIANLEISGVDVTEDLALNINKNGTYLVSATSASGQLVTKKFVVSDIVNSLAAPKQTAESEVSKGKVTVTIKGTASASNPVRDGRKAGDNLKPDENGVYTITKDYTNNGTYTEYVTDSVGNTASYQVKVTKFDTTAPVIKLKSGSAITKNKTESPESDEKVKAWLKENLDITDNRTVKNDIAIELKGSVDTSKVGAYSVRVTAKDASNNQSRLRVMVYILPTSGMLITDHNGVLFCSQSKDAALVNRNGEKQVVLTVKDYDWVKLTNVKSNSESDIVNAKAEIAVTVKQGAFREGQMKYFDKVATGRVTYSGRTATITLNVDDLPGTGWYTVLIRNAEREREFTTFFINADN